MFRRGLTGLDLTGLDRIVRLSSPMCHATYYGTCAVIDPQVMGYTMVGMAASMAPMVDW